VGRRFGGRDLVLTQIDLAGFNGTRSVYTFGKTNSTIARGCGSEDPTLPATVDVSFLSSMTLPDGSSYAMPTYATTGCATGLLTELRLPTLGAIQWTYQTFSFPQPAGDTRTYMYNVQGVQQRTIRDAAGTALGSWQFGTALTACSGGGCYPRELVNTVITPDNATTKYFFSVKLAEDTGPDSEGWDSLDYGLPFTRNTARQTSPGRLLSREIYNASAVLVRSLFGRYERERVGTGVNAPYDTNRRVVSARTVFNDDSGRYADADYSSFDGLGHYRTTTTNGNFDAGNVREAFTNYNPTAGTCTLDSQGNCIGFNMPAPTAP
jgi:hypothetical protein